MSLWHLLQSSDSLFPTGGFSHSGGMEGLVVDRLIGGDADVESAIRGILERSFATVDLPACALAHRSAGDPEALVEIDRVLDALKGPRELREASQSLGRRRLKVVVANEEYRRRVESDETPGHQSVVIGMHTSVTGVPREDALLAFSYSTSAAYVAACMKLVPFGQSRAQAFLSGLGFLALGWVRAADAMSIDDLGGFTPALDIAAMRHEVAIPRLFIS